MGRGSGLGVSAPVALVLALVLAAVPLSVAVGATSKVDNIRPCETSALRVTAKNGDGLHHGVEFLTFSNVSGTTCALSGYPTVEAILDSAKAASADDGYAPAPAGSLRRATDAQWSWAGGVDSDDVPRKTFAAPTIVLAPHSGVASSTVNWTDGPNGNGTCPAFNDLVIGIDRSSVKRYVRAFEPLCYVFVVTPLVKGATGSMFVSADYSKKANDLVNAIDTVSYMRTCAAGLRREWDDPRHFTFSQRMQEAGYLQQYLQNSTLKTPWPVLNSTMSATVHEGQMLGDDAIVSLTQSSYERRVKHAYDEFERDLNGLHKLLRQLSRTSATGFERRF